MRKQSFLLEMGTPLMNQKCAGIGTPSALHLNSTLCPPRASTDFSSMFSFQYGFAVKRKYGCTCTYQAWWTTHCNKSITNHGDMLT